MFNVKYFRQEITIPLLIKWINKRLKEEYKKRELSKDKSDVIQLGGKIRAFKEVKDYLRKNGLKSCFETLS